MSSNSEWRGSSLTDFGTEVDEEEVEVFEEEDEEEDEEAKEDNEDDGEEEVAEAIRLPSVKIQFLLNHLFLICPFPSP